MASDEEYVRSKWEKVIEQVQGHPREKPSKWHGFVLVIIGGRDEMIASGNRAERWSAARAYTEERERQIAEVEEEIALLESWRPGVMTCSDMTGATFQRILAARQAALAALKVGWKGQT